MQNWNDLVRTQLNNLASFPAKQTWKLGEWTYECHVRPEVANFAALPLVNNETGDVRVSLADQAWYIWDGAAWQSMGGGGGGGVTNVTASAPIASSGGANPNISLTGIVAAANGGTGLSVPGAVGNVLTSNGVGWSTAPLPATVTPGAPLTSVQFNNGGAFGGSAGLTWNGSTLAVDGAVDRATAGTLTVGGTTATAITVGKVGVTTTFPGPVNLTGDVTTVGGTQFTTDAQFDGNVTFGNAATDNISFVGQVDTAITQEGIAAPAVSPAGTGRIYFDSGTNTFKASQNGGAYVDIITGGTVTSVGATSPLASSGGATPTISFTGWPANASGALTNDGAGNLSWAPSGGGTITGSGVATQIAYFTGASAIGSETAVGSNSFTWDATNNRLGVGTSVPGAPLTVDGGSASGAIAQVQSSVNGNVSLAVSNATSGTAAQASLYLVTDIGAGRYGSFAVTSNGWTTNGLSLPNQYQSNIEVGLTNGILLSTQAANAPIVFAVPTVNGAGFIAAAERLRLNGSEVAVNDGAQNVDFRVEGTTDANALVVDASANAVGIGTSTPAYKLDVAANTAGGVARLSNANATGFAAVDFTLAGTQRFSFGYTGAAFGLLQNNAYFYSQNSDLMIMVQDVAAAANRPSVTFKSAETAFNDNGQDVDFRVESQTNPYMLFVDASANIVSVGTVAPGATVTSVGYPFNTVSEGASNAALAAWTFGSATPETAAKMAMERARGTAASPSALVAGDVIGEIVFNGYTNARVPAVQILGFAATGWGASGSDAPGRLEFRTAPDGSATPVERLEINAGVEAVFNDPQNNFDFRVASQANANMLLVDASQSSVSIGTSGNTHTFNVGSGSSSNFAVASGGRIHTYDGSAPTNGQVLIGDTASGNFAKATLTAGSGISITNGAGSVTIASTGGGASTAIDIPSTAQEALNAGDLVRFVNDAGTPKVQKADATNSDARLNPVGFAVAAASAGAAVTVRVSGVADVPAGRFDAAPAAANVGSRVFVSTTSGQITLTAPSASGDVLQRAGVLVDGGANPKVLVQIGDPTLL